MAWAVRMGTQPSAPSFSQLSIEENVMSLEIVAKKDGPYFVTGDLASLDLRDGEGNL